MKMNKEVIHKIEYWIEKDLQKFDNVDLLDINTEVLEVLSKWLQSDHYENAGTYDSVPIYLINISNSGFDRMLSEKEREIYDYLSLERQRNCWPQKISTIEHFDSDSSGKLHT